MHLQIAAQKKKCDRRCGKDKDFHPLFVQHLSFTFNKTDGDRKAEVLFSAYRLRLVTIRDALC